MNKLEKFFVSLEKDKRGVTATNGEYGYIITIDELLKNNGKYEFFRKAWKCKDNKYKVSRNVYYNLQYDKSDKCYYADCHSDISADSGKLKKSTIIFYGFTY